jgi:A/G-specific adenine glycosylase
MSQQAADEKLELLQHTMMNWWVQEHFDYPWRDSSEPDWKRLITEVLLQRTNAAAVKRLYVDFFFKYPTAESLACAPVEEVEQAIHSLGLRWRAQYLPSLASNIAAGVPESSDELMKLPGVGPYVSGAFMVLHRNTSSTFVDANVVRLLGRYLGFEWDGETRRKKWLLDHVDALFSHGYTPSEFGYALLDFSREVCGRAPQCQSCEARTQCAYFATLEANNRALAQDNS